MDGSFVSGFLAGQVCLLCLFFLIIKYFLFRSGSETKQEKARFLKSKKIIKNVVMEDSHFQSDSLLANRVAYLVNETEETCQWVNYLVAQLMVRYRQSRAFQQEILETLDIALNPVNRLEFLGPVSMTSFSLGDSYPRFYNARIVSQSVGTFERHKFELNFQWFDNISLTLETMIIMNWPRDCFASLPIQLAVNLIKVQGIMVLEFCTSLKGTCISLSVKEEDFDMDWEIKSLIGSKTKIKDIPKVSSIIRDRLTMAFCDFIMAPNSKDFLVPFLQNNMEIPIINNGNNVSNNSIIHSNSNSNSNSNCNNSNINSNINTAKSNHSTSTFYIQNEIISAPVNASDTTSITASASAAAYHRQIHHQHQQQQQQQYQQQQDFGLKEVPSETLGLGPNYHPNPNIYHHHQKRASVDSNSSVESGSNPYSSNPILRKWEKEASLRLRAAQKHFQANTSNNAAGSSPPLSSKASLDLQISPNGNDQHDHSSGSIISGSGEVTSSVSSPAQTPQQYHRNSRKSFVSDLRRQILSSKPDDGGSSKPVSLSTSTDETRTAKTD